MLLDTKTRSLQVGLLEGVTTLALDFNVTFTQVSYPEATVHATALGVIPGTSYIDMVPAPKDNVYKHIDEINIYNNDSITHNVFIAITDGSPYVVFRATLTVGQTLHYNEYFGWTIN
jgi:hypothetical protein